METTKQPRMGKRTKYFLGGLIVVAIIGTLIALEQISLLYALATLSLVALLLVVGFADLENINADGTSGHLETK